MNDIQILRWVLGIIGVVLVALLYWFGRADKKVYRQHKEEFNSDEYAEPYLSDDSFKLDLNQQEIKNLSSQVANDKNTNELFEDVDAFYNKVVEEQAIENEDVAPMPNIPRFNGEAEKQINLEDESSDTVNVPAWLQAKNTSETKVKQASKSKENKSNSSVSNKDKFKKSSSVTKSNGLDTVALFKDDPTEVADDINEKISFVSNHTDEEPSVDDSDVTPLKSIVANSEPSQQESSKIGNPYLDGFKNNSKKSEPKKSRVQKKQEKKAAKNQQVLPFTEAKQVELQSNIQVNEHLHETQELAASATVNHDINTEASSVMLNSNTMRAQGESTGEGAALANSQSSSPKIVSFDDDFISIQEAKDKEKYQSAVVPGDMKKISYPEAEQPRNKGQEIKHAIKAQDKSANEEYDRVAALANTNPIIRKNKDPREDEFKLSFYLAAEENASFNASDIANSALESGMTLTEDTLFEMIQDTGGGRQAIFSVCGKDRKCTFKASNTEEETTTLLEFEFNAKHSILSRLHMLDSMLRVAQNMEQSLKGKLYDIAGCQITDLMINHLRRQVQDQELKNTLKNTH